jgi:metacaspase-1
MDRLELIVRSAQQDDVVVFYFSGHGSQIRDRDGDELSDGLDELLCPYDMDWDRELYIVDDELDELFREIPPGALLETFLDCCFWGAAPMEAEPRPQGLRIDVRYLAPPLDIASRFEGDEARLSRHGFEDCGCFRGRNVLWAASAEGQPAAEDYLEGRPQGVFTYWGCRFIEANIDQIWQLGYGREHLVSDLHEYMDSLGYAQTAQLSATPPLQQVGPFMVAEEPEFWTEGYGNRRRHMPTRR